MKAAERKTLLTDKKIPPHSLHRHFTGGEEESQEPAGLLISGDLPSRRSGSIQKVYKGERSPALAEPRDSTLSCRHNSDVTHDNSL